jgi:hypothetical protein
MQTNERLSGLSRYVHTKLVTRDEFHGRMDAFAGKVDDIRFDWAKQERRITELESKRPT